jgi:hypothetical protein
LILAASFFVPFFYITAHPDFTNIQFPEAAEIYRKEIFWAYTPAWIFWWGHVLGYATLAGILFLLFGGVTERIGRWAFLAFSIALVLFALNGIALSFMRIGLENVRLWPRNGPLHTLDEIHPARVRLTFDAKNNFERMLYEDLLRKNVENGFVAVRPIPIGAAGEILGGGLWIAGAIVLIRRRD